MTELRDCPFCGREPDVPEESVDGYWVECSNPNCMALIEADTKPGTLVRLIHGEVMDYRKLLNEYYEYLGDARPVHKMITNHLLFFADWLNTHTEEE